MSWWTELRDGLETAGGLIANYFYPGTVALGHLVNSKGSQEQLYGTTWGQLASLGTGLAGGYSGNMSNYGTAMNGLGEATGASSTGAGMSGGVGAAGVGGQGYMGADGAVSAAQRMLENGASPAEVMQMTGITPDQAQAAGLSAGAGQTWGDVAQQTGMGTGSGMTGAGSLNPGGSGSGTMGGGAAGARTQGPMPFGSGAGMFNTAQGALGLLGAGQIMQAGQAAQRAADPFGPQRGQYADRMNALMADPSMIEKEPGYQAGMQAVKRSMAGQGYTGSGNMMAAMQKYGGDFYNRAMQMYGGFAGAQFNPAAGAQLGFEGNAMGLQSAWNSLNKLGYGFGMNQDWQRRQGQ